MKRLKGISKQLNMMFWNINRNYDLFPLIIELITEYSLDIFVIAEFPQIKQSRLILPDSYELHVLATEQSKIKYIYNKELEVRTLGEAPQGRGSVLLIRLNNGQSINLVGCHLVDQINYDDFERENRICDFSKFIYDIETSIANNETVVVGDFNMNPFDPGMVRARAMNSVMDKKIALKRKRTYCGQEYPFFYNPMWYFFGHPELINGTIYFNPSRDLQYYWHIFDQVLIRPSLIDSFQLDSMRIIDKINSTNLLTDNGIIDKTYSDHLPIFFSLNL